jgi:uncharacterized membrane protein YgcG
MRRITRILLLSLGLAGALGAMPAQAQQERISDFFSHIVVGADGTLTVSEIIIVNATGREIKRGIYRDFPTTYRRPDGGQHKVGFEIVEVLRDGQPIAYFTEMRSNGVRVYMGSKNIYIDPGTYTYEFTYRTTRQIGYFPEFDELYWNVTGNDWSFPIDSAAASIILPEGATVLSWDGYTGRRGEQGGDWTSGRESSGPVTFATTRSLAAGEGLTIAITWPKGIVAPPTRTAELKYFLLDNLHFAVGGGGIGLLLLFYIFAWTRAGRDPDKGTIIPLYNPPKGLSPAASRYVTRMAFDNKAIGAAVVSLAVKGHLEIESTGRKTYELRRLDNANGALLSRGEKHFKSAIFAWGDSVDIERGNHARVKPAVDRLRKALSGEFAGVSFHSNIGYVIFAILLTVATVIATSFAAVVSADPEAPLMIFGTVGAGLVINGLFIWLMKAPTLSGRKLMDRIEGFKLYLSVAEKDRLNMSNPPEQTPELFEKYLPYAMALDVENEWGDQFEEVLAAAAAGGEYRPHWYYGHHRHHWHSHSGFASGMGDALGGAIASSATPPGSSSGSGGGGSSGGGGGGGGGGGF